MGKLLVLVKRILKSNSLLFSFSNLLYCRFLDVKYRGGVIVDNHSLTCPDMGLQE